MAEANSKKCNKILRLTPAGESDVDKLKFIEEMTENCDQVQGLVLDEILKQNVETEYLRRHGLSGGANERADFKAKMPVVTYEDLLPDIMRIVNGDHSAILSALPISELFTSSGTSAGKRKLIPTNQEELDRRQLIYSFYIPVMKQYVPGLDRGKALNFMFAKPETKTAGGLPARPLFTSLYKSPNFQLQQKHSKDPFNAFTSPISAILSSDSHQSMYIQILCGLLHRLQVLRIGSPFASGLVHAIHFLQSHFHSLAADIAAGELSPSITDPSLRSSVQHILNPNPELARFVSDECSKPDWAGILTRIWPNIKYLDAIITGTMAQYVPTLQFYSGNLPMASTAYASSECLFGINLNPICPPSEISYTIMPNMAYFEFLPMDGGEGEGELVDLAGVELDKEYEIVVTTYAGLYRYRIEDVLRVTGFHNSTPQFKFLRRKNVVLSIEADKTNETELQGAVERAASVLSAAVEGVNVVEYTSQAYTDTIPGRYVIYWELLWRRKEEKLDRDVMEKCCLEMEEKMNSVYRRSRVVDRTISPLEIRVVRNGTFEVLMDFAISRGASINQYKVARCVNLKPMLEILDSRVVSSYFSKGLPKWSPSLFG